MPVYSESNNKQRGTPEAIKHTTTIRPQLDTRVRIAVIQTL